MDSPISAEELGVDLKDLAGDYPPFLKVNEDGTVERYLGTEIVKASHDVKTNVVSKDVSISPDSSIAARLFLPKPITDQNQKLPTVVYFHGGAFCIHTPYSPTYHNHLNLLVSQANVVAVSVEYRKAPEFPLPTALEDSWSALKWVTSHSESDGPDEWLNRYADLKQLFFVGDSAGANISHHMAIKMGKEDHISSAVKLQGIVLVHPYFWGEPVPKVVPPGMADPDVMWHLLCPTSKGSDDDPMVNPSKDMEMKSVGCRRVLVFVAGLDWLFREWGLYYKQLLEKIGWDGIAELIEHKNQLHVFHLDYPTCEDAVSLVNAIVAFINM